LIAEAVNNILKDATLAKQLHEGALAAREVYNWQEEEKKLVQIYSRL
jgi:glycosyltransferase involved in cell wall biosynthesis